MNRNQSLLMVCVLGLGLSAESMAGAIITVDGSLSDWGLFTTTKTWLPDGSNGTKINYKKNGKDGIYYTASGSYPHEDYNIYYAIDDYISGGNGFLDPGYGGQAYDAEALYVTWDADNLYIALVTGHNPNTKQNENNNTYSAGDFALNFWSGATPDSDYEFGIRTPHKNNNINGINNPFFTTDVYQTTNEKDWLKDPLWGTDAVTSLDMNQLKDQNRVGSATMSIKKGPNNIGAGSGPHWIYEISVDKDLFGDAFKNNNGLNISWTMNCANDIITVEDDIPTIDEPPIWALLGLTLPAVFWRRRRSAKR